MSMEEGGKWQSMLAAFLLADSWAQPPNLRNYCSMSRCTDHEPSLMSNREEFKSTIVTSFSTLAPS